ncbi:MAG: hypothetical protein P1V97_20830 [Planctomycetota bacterium]|nr:hypothetical protein [Planctomycetota bacterium]
MSGDDHDTPIPGQTDAGQTTMENSQKPETSGPAEVTEKPSEAQCPEANSNSQGTPVDSNPPESVEAPAVLAVESEARTTEDSDEVDGCDSKAAGVKEEQAEPVSESEAAVEAAQETKEEAEAAQDKAIEGASDVLEITAGSQDFTLESPEVLSMAEETGVSPEAALAIHMGQTTLKRALQNAKKREQLYAFAIENNLPHSLAGQVLKEQMTLEEASVRARVIAHRRRSAEHCSFKLAHDAKEKVILGLHSQKEVTTPILAVLKYDIRVVLDGEEIDIPKHSVKYLYKPDHKKIIRKTVKHDKTLAKNPKGPITKVAKRFKVKDDLLQKVIDLKSHLSVTLLEGEKVAAELRSYSKYEILLHARDDHELVVFRHALEQADAVPLEEVLAAERYAKKMSKKAPKGSPKGKKKKRR